MVLAEQSIAEQEIAMDNHSKTSINLYMRYITKVVFSYPSANHVILYSCINIANYIEITTIMECQISGVILSYNSTNCLS